MDNNAIMRVCELCCRQVLSTTKHHLIPRTVHSNKWFKKNFKKSDFIKTVNLCRDCHKQIHKFIPEKEMGKAFNTIELLKEHPQVEKFLEWLTKRSAEK